MMRTRKGHPVYPLTVAQKFHLYYKDTCPVKSVVNIGTSLTIGVDIEKIHHLKADIAKKCLSPKEQADLAAADDPESYLFRLWVLKECYCKYTGEGLFMPFKSASFDIAEDSQIHCGAAPRLSFKEYDIDPLYKMAACSAAGLPKDVHIVSLPEICARLRLSEPAI